MLSLFLALAEAHAVGFQTVKVTPRRPFRISLSAELLVVALDDVPDVNVSFACVDRANRSFPIPLYGLSYFQLANVTLVVTAPPSVAFTLPFWVLPPHFCASDNYVAIADRRLLVNLTARSGAREACIFSQSGASSHDVQLTSHGTVIDFFTRPDHLFRTCTDECDFNYGLPFIVRLRNLTADFAVTFDLTVFRKDLDSHECDFREIPRLAKSSVVGGGGTLVISEPNCLSMAEAIVSYMAVGGAIAVTIVGMLVLLWKMGFIDLSAVCSCSQEYEKFESLREGAYAHVLETDGVSGGDS
jgi:hypothetical protein